MRRVYVVRLPLQGEVQWFDVCRCESAEKAAEVVRAILAASEGEPVRILVESQHAL